MTTNATTTPKMSVGEFVILAIMKLRAKKPQYKGIHTVYSGFNEAFREYFGGADPIAATKKLQSEGVLAITGARGGAMLYLPADVPARASKLSEILG